MSDTELLARMMIRQSLSTGHGDTVADLVRELEPQIERLRAEVAELKETIRQKEENEKAGNLSFMDVVKERDLLRELLLAATLLAVGGQHDEQRCR